MQKRWVIKEPGNEAVVNSLSETLGVEKILANLLVQRGVSNVEEARAFFRPSLDDLHDPFLMKDMDKAVSRLSQAINNKERVLIYGDYDVDGTTSVALLYTFLKKKIDRIEYYIPDRYAEGYGISKQGIDYAIEQGFSLVIALDCGIKAVQKIAYACKQGVDFIICDHHTPGDELPKAVAVLDPKRSDCNYPCKYLSGCGVGFKLVQAYNQKHNLPFDELIPLLDLLCVSIASDIVPIVGENRVLAYFGLKQLSANPRIGLKTILNLAGISNNLSISDIVFKVAPRINAAGRIQSGRQAVQLLVADSTEAAFAIGNTIDGINTHRRELDHSITDEALQKVDSSTELRNRKSTVLFDSGWNKGVIGIVASRVIETYYKPTVILTAADGFATGSARSIDGFDLYQAISSCSDLLESYGGHKYAAGLTLKTENISAFQERFENYVCKHITDDMLMPHIKADAKIKLSDITPKFCRIIKQFAPFGPMNMTPVFVSEDVVDFGNSRPVGKKGEHLKLSVIDDIQNGKVRNGIAFSMGESYDTISRGVPFDICYTLQENEYRGVVETQLLIRDMKI